MQRRTFVAGVAGATAALSGCVSTLNDFRTASRSGSRTYDVDAGTSLRVVNRTGSVTAERHDGDEVTLDFEIEGPSNDAVEAVSVTDSREDGELRLEVEPGDSSADDLGVSMTVRYPDSVLVGRMRTRSGSIDVDVPGVEDGAEIESTNGSVDAALASDLDAALTATTTNGSVTVHDLELDSSSTSNAEVSGTLGDGSKSLTLRIENGSIDLRSLSD